MQTEVNSDGDLVSKLFTETYFSHKYPLEESSHVFLEGNSLQQKFEKLTKFVIAETGFGSGLNFLNTVMLWNTMLKARPSNHENMLLFYSFEKYPLNWELLQKFYKNIEIDNTLKNLFLEKLFIKDLVSNQDYTFDFEDYNCRLVLSIGDIKDTIQKQKFKANAWFFDGFSPSKNPEMWSAFLFKHIRKLTFENGSFATYTAAGSVKRVLRENGFFVKRVKGFGKKRHMLIGNLINKDGFS